MRYPTSLQDKRYPDFIRKSIITRAYPKPEKVFPRIGLKNSEKLVSSLRVSQTVRMNVLYNRLNQLPLSPRPAHDAKLSKEQQTMEVFFEELYGLLGDNCPLQDTGLLNNVGMKLYLKVPTTRCFPFKLDKDRDLIKLIKTAQAYSKKHKLGLKAFENFDLSIKSTSLLDICPVKNKGAKVVFASGGNKGYWDIATMSMRGITSCMKWEGSTHATKLVGSIIDPYAGIIYLTDGTKTDKGEKMIARAVVRLVVCDNDKRNGGKLALFLEQAYLSNGIKNIDGVVGNITAIFTSFLHEKTSGAYTIVSNEDNDYDSNVSIPMTEPIKSILEINGHQYEDDSHPSLSYRDSNLEYVEDKKFFDPKKISLKDFRKSV